MKIIAMLLLMILISSFCFAEETANDPIVNQPKITFLELGSLTCIPCKQMKKVLESVSEKYGDQIEIIFHDVKKEKDIAKKFKVRMIPTQVFLDADGKEIHRHIGFYPEAQIDEFLQKQGLKIIHSEEL